MTRATRLARGEAVTDATYTDVLQANELMYRSDPSCEVPVDRGTYATRCGHCLPCREFATALPARRRKP